MGDHKHKKSWQKDTLVTLPGQPAEKKSVAGKQGTLNRQTNLLLTESLTNPRWSMVNPALQKRAGGPGNFGLQKREYLVEGAELTCSQGSCNGKLKIPEGHHYLSGDRKKANCRDCVEGGNIPYFGNCSLRGEEGGCEGFMLLDEQWRNTERPFHEFEVEYVDGEPAIITSSVLLCKRGGIIRPVTSGQGYDGRLSGGVPHPSRREHDPHGIRRHAEPLPEDLPQRSGVFIRLQPAEPAGTDHAANRRNHTLSV